MFTKKGVMSLNKLFIACVFCLVGSIAYSQNLWTQLPDPTFSTRTTGIEFSMDTDGDGNADKGFIGAGFDFNTQNYSDFWQFDPTSGVWTQKANFPGTGKRNFANFQLNGIAYVAFGAYGSTGLSDELWAYDPVTNIWTQKNDIPSGGRWGVFTLMLNGKAYLGLGNGSGSSSNPQFRNDFYQYDPINDSWLAMASFPGQGRIEPGSISVDTNNDGINDRGFLVAGGNLSSVFSDVWEYLPSSDTWVQKQNIPVARMSPTVFALNNEPYVGLGNASATVLTDLWKYDVAADSWLRMSDFPGTAVWGTYEFVVDNTAYILDGASSAGNVTRQFYKYSPLLNGYSEIRGSIFADGDADCTLSASEFSLANIPVQALPGPYLTSTDANGDYVVRVPTGTYSVSTILPVHLSQSFPSINCPSGNIHADIIIAALGIDTSGFDFAVEALQCPRLSVQVNSSGRLRCFYNNTVINYCNYGLVDEDSVYIVLNLPDFVTIDNASETFVSLGNDTYEFYIGNVAAGFCGQIDLVDYVSCTDVNLLGAVACTEVNIYPYNDCLPQDTLWNGANIEITASCLAPSDTIQLVLTNSGTNAMADSSELRVFFDGSLGYTENFLLAVGETYTLLIPSNGATIMAEADQVVGHPYNFHVVAWVERCGVDTLQAPLFTIIPDLPLGDEFEQNDVECMSVSGSYDPNDKQAFPSGVTPANIIPPGKAINYKLRFQNTGNGVAQNVYLVDTLDANLDIATLRMNTATHAYRMQLSGQGKNIVTFYFDNIMLPDSNVSQLLSQGFISFSISPKASTPLGTVIENFADIYFDFNPPVRTNTVMLTLDNLPVNIIGVREGNVLVLGAKDVVDGKQQLYMYPNPAQSTLNIVATFPSTGQAEVMVMDLLGRTLLQERYFGSAGSFEVLGLDISNLQAGVYIVMINRNGSITTGKLIKE